MMKPSKVEVLTDSKKRSHIRKQYVARSPYKRLMGFQDVKLEVKEKLRKIRDNLDFREISRQIVEYWQDLERVHFKKGKKNNGKPVLFGDI